MRILIAEDDEVSRRLLQRTLAAWGHEVITTKDGAAACIELEREDAPPLAILDWMMPGMDGLEVCRRTRQMQREMPAYLILLTAKGSKQEVVQGLDAGANDYVTKPFDRDELRARVQVGATVIRLQRSLVERVRELEDALAHVKQIQGILPICTYCKNVRDDQNYWQRVERYISDHSEAQFSHSVCPQCYEERVAPELEKFKSASKAAEHFAE